MEHLLSDQSKFQKTTVKDDELLNFTTSLEKRIDKIYKKLVDSKNLSEKTRNMQCHTQSFFGHTGTCTETGT